MIFYSDSMAQGKNTIISVIVSLALFTKLAKQFEAYLENEGNKVNKM